MFALVTGSSSLLLSFAFGLKEPIENVAGVSQFPDLGFGLIVTMTIP
jgi:hypothetical protein